MKRRAGTALLALVMTLSCVSPAMAVEESTDYEALQAQIDAIYTQIDGLYEQVYEMEDQMSARYAGYYTTYGDMADWDDATWELSGTWTEAEWNGYWYGMEIAEGEHDYLAEYKAEMGMWFPEGINVCVDGRYLDTAPTAIDGVTYLPADVLLAALGLESTEVPAVELGGTACLPIRAVAQAAGYDVAWDEWYEVVEVDHWGRAAAEIDREFTVLNTILAASMNTVDPAKTYASKGSAEVLFTLYGEEKHDTAKFTMDLEGIVKGDYSAMYAGYEMAADLGDLEDVLAELGGQEVLEVIDSLNGGMEMMLDGRNGGIYFKSDLWSGLDSPLPDDKWVAMEDGGFGAAYTGILAGLREMTVGSLLVSLAAGDRGVLEQAADVMRLLAGDDLFAVSERGGVTTYTCKMDMVKLAARAAALGLFTAEDIGSLFGDTGLPSAHYTLTAKVSGDKLTAMTAKGELAWSVLSLEFDVDSTATKGESYLALKSRYLGKIEMTVSETVTETIRSLPAIPADCLDYNTLMEDYYATLYGYYEW